MLFSLLKEIARPHWMEILASIKRGKGKAMGEIAEDIGISYMGAKQQCDHMVKAGFLETFRRPRTTGRPEKIYRLTSKAIPLFPTNSNDVILDLLKTVGEIYGSAATEKLVFNFFQKRTHFYKLKIKGKSVAERATSLAKLREAEGYLSKVAFDNKLGFRIEEFHHPMEEICRSYPILLKAEEKMFEQLIGSKITREQWKSGGQTVQIFQIATL